MLNLTVCPAWRSGTSSRMQPLCRGAAAQLLWVLVCILASCRGQMPMPFSGAGDNPPAVPTDVFVSTYVERMLYVNDNSYDFQAVILFYLSWRDPRVKDQVPASTARATRDNGTCQLPCQSNQKVASGGCCDDVWMPYVAFTNLKYLPQDRVVRYGFNYDRDHDGVFYWRSVHGVWYTPMDLRAFPFDYQNLMVQMETPQARVGWSGSIVRLRPSTAGTAMFTAKTSGDDVSGWSVREVIQRPYSYPLCQTFLGSAQGPSHPDDPYPLVSEHLWQLREAGQPLGSCNDSITEQGEVVKQQSPFWRAPLSAGSDPGVVEVSGLNVVLLVQRYHTRWVLSAIFPIMATTWLGFLVFFLPRKDMNGRLGAIVALFLALAAIQFVIDSSMPSSSYMTSLQILTLLSYLTLVAVGAENTLLWYLTIYHRDKARVEQHRVAQRRFEQRLQSLHAAVGVWMQQHAQHISSAANDLAGGVGRVASMSATAGAGVGSSSGGGASVGAAGVPAAGGTAARSAAVSGSGATAGAPRTALQVPDPSGAAADVGGVGAAASKGPTPTQSPGSSVPASPSRPPSYPLPPSPSVPRQLGAAVAADTVPPAPAAAAGVVDRSGVGSSTAPPSKSLWGLAQQMVTGASSTTPDSSQQQASPAVTGAVTPSATLLHSAASINVAAATVDAAAVAGMVAAQEMGLANLGSASPVFDGLRPDRLAAGDRQHTQQQQQQQRSPSHSGQLPTSWLPAAAKSADEPDMPAGIHRRWQVFVHTLRTDSAYADRFARRLNQTLAVTQFIGYNLAAILVFVINTTLYSRPSLG